MLAIIDYGAGNQTSVKRALEHLGIPCFITAKPQDLPGAQGIIFPGVGAARQAMTALVERGLDRAIWEAVAKNQPLLGICLGCQILLEHSEEDDTPTLGLLPGVSRRFKPDWQDGNEPIRIPHMGWNRVSRTGPCDLWDSIAEDAEFYFVHSYYVEPEPSLWLGSTNYGREFCSVYGRPGLWCAQFHPEKSGQPGLTFLANFHAYCLGERP